MKSCRSKSCKAHDLNPLPSSLRTMTNTVTQNSDLKGTQVLKMKVAGGNVIQNLAETLAKSTSSRSGHSLHRVRLPKLPIYIMGVEWNSKQDDDSVTRCAWVQGTPKMHVKSHGSFLKQKNEILQNVRMIANVS